jgi:hypothetical protein
MSDYFEKMENPFLIDVPDKNEYTNEELNVIQEKLHNKNIDTFLESLYPKNTGFRTTYEEMHRRTTRCLKQNLIDISNNILPTKNLYKVGNGGNGKNCIVTCAPLLDIRANLSQTILNSLENVGFNGYFYLLNGGYPNPTGIEMKYVGVPYAFKIFLMLEAEKLGFENVIWIDSACYAVNNPEFLFSHLSMNDVVFRVFPPNCFSENTFENIIFPKTLTLLNTLVNRDVRNDLNINSIVFGLNLKSPIIKNFISEYYDMVKLGLPFLTSFPEEIVFDVLFNKDEYKHFFNNKLYSIHAKLYIHEYYISEENAKKSGYYFIQRQH